MEVPWRGALCFSVLCVVSSIAASTCKSSCRGAGGPFHEGQVYKYQLEGSSVTHLPGSPTEVTSLGISATAEVFAESKCQHVLKLSNVQVKGPDGKKYDGLAADCAKPVKFSYDEGKLTELCGEADDRGAGLNIKRAVISLVSSLKSKDAGTDNGYENDVFGICPTDFTFSKAGTKLTIHKTKNLNRCALREEFNFPFPTTTYQAVQSSFGSFETSPLLGAELKVEQELDNGVLQKATGEELYAYRPLVNPEAGATVKVSYTLTLQGANAGSIPANVNSPKVVFYEASHDEDGIKNHDAISAALQKATASLDPVATPDAAKHFAHLVHAIEQGSKGDIMQAYNAAQGKTAKSLFLDGLLYAGSADSVEAAADLLSSKKIPEESALRWYLDLNFVKHASRGSLTSLVPLLSGDKVPHQAYLGIGAVAGKFCLEHRQLCETSPEFKTLQTKLAEPLAKGCKVDSHEKENTVIASLKGLRNTRHLTDEVAQKVIQCATDKSAKSRVRVAAIEAFFADAGKPAIQQAATSILKDVEEDSELRIKSYLALVESPSPKVADTIKDLVDSEPINQVGAFVVSHLRNLRASVSPDKEAAKQFLGNIISKKKYPIDQRKFSRNYEVSYSVDALNVGAVGEVNRIFSQKSFIPRSVSLNLTTQIFGHSVNLAEIGLRAENLEYHFERYFGPKGVFHTKGHKFVDEAAEKAEEAMRRAKEKFEAARPKRSISKQEADAATSKVQLGPDYDDLYTDLDLSVKLFGSDIGWINYHHDRVDYNNLKKKLQGKFDETLDKSKSIDIDYKKGRNFFNAGVTYPTGLGFALKVNVDGNSAVNIKVTGNLDAKAIASHPQNSHIAFQVVPSGSIEVTSLLAIDAHVVEAGVKVAATIHSSTGLDLTVKVLDGYGVDVKIGLPVKKLELLNFNSDVVSIVREKKGPEVESPIKFDVQRQEHGGCFDQLSAISGLTFCGEVSIPMEGFKVLSPSYGPSKASIRLEKDDESLTAYHFKAFYNNKQADQMAIEVLLDTPNSKTNRKFSLNIHGALKPQKELTINFVSPFKTATFEGHVIDTESEQAVSAKFLSEGDEYSFKAGAHVSGDANRKKYEPLLEYKYPESAKAERAWIGRKGAAKGGRPQQSTLGVTGAVFVEKTPGSPFRKYELKSVTLTTPRIKITVDGVVTIDSNLVDTDIKATYDKESFVLNSRFKKLEDQKFIAKIEFSPSQYPDLGGSINWEFEKKPDKIENKLVVVHGPDLKSETSRLSLSQMLKYKYENIKAFDFQTDNSVSYPLLGVSALMKGGVTPKHIHYDVDATYDKTQVTSKLDAKTGTKHPTDYSVEFEGKALGNSIDLTCKHERLSGTKSKFTNSLEMKPGGKYQLNALSEVNAKPGDVHQSLEAELKLPQEPKIVKLKTELKHNNKEDELEFELSAGNKQIIDFELELHKKVDPSGKFKLLLPKYIDSNGAFETKSGKSTGSFHAKLVKTGREIEGKGELVKAGTNYKGSADLSWDAKKDPTKKIHWETVTDFVNGKSIDTKNNFQVLEHKTSVNAKGTLEGSYNDGTVVGEAEVILPSGRVVAGKVNRAIHLGSEDNSIDGTWEVSESASKGAPPRKLTLKLAGKNIKLVKLQFDGQADLTYVSPNNEDVTLHLKGKKVPQGDKWTVSGEGSVSGALVKRPVHTKLNAEVSDELLKAHLSADKSFPPAHYHFEIKAGDDISFVSNGKLNKDQLSNDVELKLPTDLPVTSITWKTANTLNVFVSESASRKVISNNDVHWNKDNFVKVNVEANEEKDGGHGKVSWESHKYSVRTLTYKLHGDAKKEKADLDLALQYEGKSADISVTVNGASNPIHLHVVSNVPEKGKFEVDLSHKSSGDGATRETTVSASGNGKNLNYHSHYSLSKTNPYFDVSLELPQGKSRAYVKLDKKGPNHALVDSKFNWFTNGGGSLEMNGEVNLKSIEDFYVKMHADSAKLNWNKVDIEAKTSGKTVSFNGKSGDKEIGGSLALTSKGTSPNIEYEGTGELKIGGATHPLEFKFKNELNEAKRHEVNVHVKAGTHSFTSHSITERDEANSVFKMDSSTKYCGEKGCKSDEIKISSKRKGLDFESRGDAKLDLSTHLVLEHPLVLKNHWKKEALKFDSGFEAEYGTEKLQYHAYANEDHAGVDLTLPKRLISAEVTYELAKNKKSKVEASFWLDKKNAAADKTSVLLVMEINKLPDGVQSSSEARFNTPGLKELSVKGDMTVNTKDHSVNAKVEADIFAKKNQKLVAEYKAIVKRDKDSFSANDNLHIQSKGLNVETQLERKISMSKTSFSYAVSGFYTDSKQAKREAIAKISVNPKSFVALVKLPEATLYSADLVIEKGDKQLHSKGKYEVLGYKFEEETEIKGTHLKLTIVQKNENNPQLDIGIGFTLGQVAEVNGQFNKKPFVSVEVALDEAHFLKSKHSYDTDVAKELLKLSKENAVGMLKEASRVGKESGAKLAHELNERAEIYRKALPNFKPAAQHYQKELQEMKEQFTSNKNVKDVIDFLKNTFGAIFTQISAILHQIASTGEHLHSLLNEAVQKVTESVKAAIPKLKESYAKASEIIIGVLDNALKYALSALNVVFDKIKEHEKEIQEMTSVVTDFLHDMGQLFAKSFGAIQKEIKDFVHMLWDSVQNLPAYTMLKEKLQELKNYKIPEQYWETYHDVVTSATQFLPTPELQQLLKTLSENLEKIVKQQPINSPEVLQQLYKELVAAVRSVLSIVQTHNIPGDKAAIPSNIFLPIPTFSMLVAPPGTFRFSLFNWVRSSDLPTLSDIFHAYRPQHSPLDIIPPFKASALLVGGTEFFTFDKKHFSFKGSCSYILSKDVIDGNFTIVANMEGGKLKSITAFDHVNGVELLNDNSVLFNGKPAELPIHEGDLHMFSRFLDGVGFATNSGVFFFCTPNLKTCAFQINGFYFGKTRGLLGTYNNEPYDDTTVPSGKVAKSTAEFANSWKGSAQCSDGAVHEQVAPLADECTKLFAGDSNLRSCFSFENQEKFREACNKKVAEASAEHKQEEACTIARAYTGYCYYVHFVRMRLPDQCGKCQVGAQTLKIGESATTTAPKKQADVVFVVEQLEENEEVYKNLITPLVSSLTNDFKEKGITDVNFALIGFGAPEQKWPSIYTFNGKYDEFAGTAKNIYFAKQPEVAEPKLSDRLEEIWKRLAIETGTTKGGDAMKEAFNYPFRPEAVKTVVGVVSSPCDRAVLPFQTMRILLARLNLLNSGVVVNLVAPLKDLKIEGKDDKVAANIVGFDSNSVYSQSEAKRKVLQGDEDAFKNLKYTSDVCVDMALGVNGAVFSSTNFVNGKPNLRKNFLQVLSNKITDSLTSDELTEDCRCELDRGMVARTKCRVSSRKEKATKG